MSRDRAADAEECKAKGNKALQAQDFDSAVDWYSEAIKLNGSNHVYYSNRSAAYLSKGFSETALKDAQECIRIKPEWAKGYSRKGAALHKMKEYKKSIVAFEKGLEIDPSNGALQSGLAEVKKEMAGPPPSTYAANPGGPGTGMGGMGGMGGGGAGGLGQIFGGDMFDRIRADPKVAKFMEDPQYVQMMTMLQSKPEMLNQFMQDQRVMATISSLLGVDVEAMQNAARDKERDDELSAKERIKKRKADEAARKVQEALDAETPEQTAARETREAADVHKARGNEHYKKREFEEAMVAYDTAIETDPTNMMYHTNRAAVMLELGNVDECLEECKAAIEKGRRNYADYKLVAKAMARAGNACYKHNRTEDAVEWYQKAQLEAQSDDTKKRLKKAQARLKKEVDEAYLDPTKAAEAKARGNDFFKAGNFPDAVKQYSDAIKRDPSNAVYYANRAAALTKLADFNSAKADCSKSLEIDPKYVKAYSRRGAIEFFMKEYHRAIATYETALKIDPESQDCKDGLARTLAAVRSQSGTANQERASHAMADPEIQAIMSDPVMRQVLNDLSTDPASAQKHMSNPGVAAKIEKLIAAGVIQTR